MSDVQRTYIPAAGHDLTLPLYDPLVKLLGGDAARRRLVEHAGLQPGHRVLEIGCGTGALLMQIARAHRDVALTGLDPDPRALARARIKATAASVPIQLDRGFSDALPYPEGTFDRVFSCFMFHHLDTVEAKRNTLREVCRVLKPGGRLQLLDFVRPPKTRFDLVGWLHSSERLADNTEGRILSLMHDAGLAAPVVLQHGAMFLVLHTAYFQGIARRDQ